MIRRDSYIYVYFRLNGSPCYVGKGIGDRWKRHLKRAANKRLAKLLKDSEYSLPVVIVRAGLTDKEASKVERALIKAIGRGRKGPLVNMTDGGDGTVGYKRTEEQKANLKKGWQGKKGEVRKARASLRGRIQMRDPNQVEALRTRNLGNTHALGCKWDKDHRAAISRAISERNRNTVVSDGTRAIRSANMKALWKRKRSQMLAGQRAARS